MLRLPYILPLLLVVLFMSALRAQDEDMKKLSCRVTSSGQGKAILIDRGSRDGLEKGDSVVLSPREGGTLHGKVSSVSSRSSAITLTGSQVIPAPGTRGEVRIPKSRAPTKTKKPVEEPGGKGVIAPVVIPKGQETPRPDPAWRNPDKDYRGGMPLLTGLKPRRPEDRQTRITGSVYMFADLTLDGAGADNSVFRVGTDLSVENFLHYGDLHVNGEINYATEYNDIAGMDLLMRRLSYVIGGHRFDNHRLEFGRFLQHGVPEFQYLDGVEWDLRLGGSNRLGASIGFMPEPDGDFESLTDSQFSLYYEWVNGLAEVLSLTAAYQKTFHRGTSDRDLFLAKLRYSPADAWNINGTAWIDLYDSRDQLKNSTVEITEAWFSLNRLWDDGSGMDITYRHSAFPDLLRREFIPPFPPTEITDSYYDRLSWRAWKAYTDGGRLHTRIMGFNDQDGPGWSTDLGREWRNWFQTASRTDLSIYGGHATTVNSIGGRIDYRVPSAGGHWNWLYDISFRHNLDIADDRDDWFQHRLRGSHDFKMFGDWETHLYSEARLWDVEFSWSIGIFIQRSF